MPIFHLYVCKHSNEIRVYNWCGFPDLPPVLGVTHWHRCIFISIYWLAVCRFLDDCASDGNLRVPIRLRYIVSLWEIDLRYVAAFCARVLLLDLGSVFAGAHVRKNFFHVLALLLRSWHLNACIRFLFKDILLYLTGTARCHWTMLSCLLLFLLRRYHDIERGRRSLSFNWRRLPVLFISKKNWMQMMDRLYHFRQIRVVILERQLHSCRFFFLLKL